MNTLDVVSKSLPEMHNIESFHSILILNYSGKKSVNEKTMIHSMLKIERIFRDYLIFYL